ncbi:hypothetical protein BCR44DRAFT_354844 [Catenaria anguillulae PL171]|uniref:Uncharacterized protein n=1 Tax=Catenaria anguillulae PL171 TaxID=765915 RepID=A0A1Y2HDD4_9FUNG|nr:hypothetical protein BCR44DRAFT_354844 [Catenaria anguillulae PL171]
MPRSLDLCTRRPCFPRAALHARGFYPTLALEPTKMRSLLDDYQLDCGPDPCVKVASLVPRTLLDRKFSRECGLLAYLSVQWRCVPVQLSLQKEWPCISSAPSVVGIMDFAGSSHHINPYASAMDLPVIQAAARDYVSLLDFGSDGDLCCIQMDLLVCGFRIASGCLSVVLLPALLVLLAVATAGSFLVIPSGRACACVSVSLITSSVVLQQSRHRVKKLLTMAAVCVRQMPSLSSISEESVHLYS